MTRLYDWMATRLHCCGVGCGCGCIVLPIIAAGVAGGGWATWVVLS